MKIQNNQSVDKFEIYAGFKKDNDLETKVQVGTAFKNDDENYYKIKLMMFPNQTYYLIKNHAEVSRYTIFSKMVIEANGKNKFLNPVGSGVLDPQMLNYLELRFPLLRSYIFMSLYPQTSYKKAA